MYFCSNAKVTLSTRISSCSAQHHLPMKELSVINAFYFDVLDLILEDGIGPMIVCLMKGLFGAPMSVHYMAYYFCVLCDQTVHSLDPYTCSFWNPLLDNLMRPCMSHNLHHALNRGHYTIWPLHHFVGVAGVKLDPKSVEGFEEDVKEYNKTFDTAFPVEL